MSFKGWKGEGGILMSPIVQHTAPPQYWFAWYRCNHCGLEFNGGGGCLDVYCPTCDVSDAEYLGEGTKTEAPKGEDRKPVAAWTKECKCLIG